MGIAFMLDPDLDEFVGADDDTVDDQLCKVAKRCSILTPTTGMPKLTAEMLAFKVKSGVEAKSRGISIRNQALVITGVPR
ncbi:hypothetical protein L917_21610, partial [Phytophthora nicotianae]